MNWPIIILGIIIILQELQIIFMNRHLEDVEFLLGVFLDDKIKKSIMLIDEDEDVDE